MDFWKTLPVIIREIVAPMALMKTARKHKIWEVLKANGVDIVNDFPATAANVAQVQGHIRRMRKKGKGKNAGTMGALSQFLEDHLVGLDEVDELEDEHRVFVRGRPLAVQLQQLLALRQVQALAGLGDLQRRNDRPRDLPHRPHRRRAQARPAQKGQGRRGPVADGLMTAARARPDLQVPP